MYISTTEAAKKFNISKRRVQFLCKQNDILGAIKVSGVWLIPDNAIKPTDRRKKIIEDYPIPSNIPDEPISLQEACNILSISTATAKNWLRLGKLIATEDGTTFQKSYILSLAKRMDSGEDNRLKSRRNKKSLKGKFIYKDYIYDTYNQSVMEEILSIKSNLTERELRLVLANFAIQLFYQSRGKQLESNIVLYDYIKKTPKNNVFYSLITNFIGTLEPIHTLSSDLVNILNHRLNFIRNEDTLGFCYISLRDIHQRKLTGTYYTPKKTIHILIDNVINYTDLYSATIFDPCCGTGNFLIELLERGVNIHNIYAQDIDTISILLTQINIAFALGIVTGNNKQYIVHESKETFEIVLKGSDIQRYSVKETNNYIKFQPDKFQQIASTEVYRAPEKLLYRFICEVPVFTYDNKQTLSLNSCNILIPKIEGLHIKYILAILNSTVATFFFSKKFRFLKLLRSHLEQLPIPLVDMIRQEQIIEKVDHLLFSKENVKQQYEELDEAIMNLYQLNDAQKQIIKQGISEKNLFLMK